jgi:ATP-dependent Lon protease
MAEYFQQHNEFDAKVFSERLPTELHQVYNTSILFPLPDLKDAKSYQAEIEKTTKELRDVYLRERIKKVSEELKKAEKDNNEDEALRLGDEQVRLVGLLQSS